MASLISNGYALDHTPAAAVAAGDVIVVGDIVGVAPRDIAANELGSIQIAGVFAMPKASGTNIAAGAKVYWNASSKIATVTNTDKFCGHAVAAAGSGTVEVAVLLDRVN